MNILLINHYAGSLKYGMEFRPYYFARKWVEKGHNVTVLAASFSHLRHKQPEKEREEIDGIAYQYFSTPTYSGNGMKRILTMLSFPLKLRLNAKRIAAERKFDVVIASSTYPLDIYPAKKIADLCSAKLIFEVHDLWPLSPMLLGGYSEKHPFIKVMQRAEDYAYAHCDCVVSLLPNADKHMLKRGLKQEKFYYIPNGIVKQDWLNMPEAPVEYRQVFDSLREEGKFIVCYFGGHNLSNALEHLIEAAAQIEDEDIIFVMVGDGDKKAELIKESTHSGKNNIVFLPPVSKKYIPKILDMTDVVYFGAAKNPLYEYGVAMNKIFDSMMAAKPVICGVEASNDIIGDAKAGLTIAAEDATAINEAIAALKAMTPQQRAEMGENGRRTVLEQYEYETLSEQFLNVMVNC
jgi:glycosyltransferase involved in cell wall biosynthesis